jgi:hypothetical protein
MWVEFLVQDPLDKENPVGHLVHADEDVEEQLWHEILHREHELRPV